MRGLRPRIAEAYDSFAARVKWLRCFILSGGESKYPLLCDSLWKSDAHKEAVTAVYLSLYFQDLEWLEYLLQIETPLTEPGLPFFAFHWNVSTLRKLFDNKVVLTNSEGKDLLVKIVGQVYPEGVLELETRKDWEAYLVYVVRFLIRKGLNIKATASKALFWGVDVGNRAVVQLLLDEGADPNGFVEENNPYGTALHVAILKNRWMEVKMLVDASADVTRQTDCLVLTNAQDRVNNINKTTPMELASLLGRQVTLDKVLLSGHTGSDAREKFKTKYRQPVKQYYHRRKRALQT
jgi:hypothetical protein